mmetsp:Transcript_24445/g.52698  ORF Transcript_24445/g.52698 Transcript_24445/m.52698 type:complete len:206 (+) Transcript_24445:75-692(+)
MPQFISSVAQQLTANKQLTRKMKFSAAILAPLLAHEALAFVPSSTHYQPQSTTALQATKHTNIAAAASACLLGLGLSAQAAFATDMTMTPQQDQFQYSSTAISSSTIVAEIDQFSLPSYDSSKGTTLIDISGELGNVNKKTLSTAKANREKDDRSPEKLEADALRAAEKEGGSLMDSMLGTSDKEQKARVQAEIQESRDNRWKTF